MQDLVRRIVALVGSVVFVAGLWGCASGTGGVKPAQLQQLGIEAFVSPRVALNLDAGWKFIRKDVDGAQQPDFDDSGWDSVNLPHTWNNLDGEDGGDNYYRGPAWYRRHLTIGSDLQGKSIYLHFGAAGSHAWVYVNGKLAGPDHKGFFSAFCYDITPLLDPSGDNVISVRVTNRRDSTIPPLSGDFTMFGGLYREVWMLALNPVCISPVDDASPGVYVRETNVSADHADLQVTTKLRNSGRAAAVIGVTCELVDASGATVQFAVGEQNLYAGANADDVQTLSVDHPHLWNGRIDPYLYHVQVSLRQGSKLVDRVVQPVGIRFFACDPDRGFLLNGQSYPLHGVNRHQDRIDMGWAITSREQQEDFDLIMEMGCTGIRLAHYQHAQEFYDLCDRGGLVVWAESSMVNDVGSSQGFKDTALQQLRELIKQSYNHPSICFWSLFNELHAAPGKGQSAAEAKRIIDREVEVVKALNDEAHALDPTRLTTAATLASQGPIPLNLVTDVIGFNRYYGWYNDTPAAWPQGIDSLHQSMAGHAIAISEYGAGASVFEHEIDPRQPQTVSFWHPEEWQGVVHEAAYKAMKDRPYLWGTFLWNMFDFAVDSRHEGDHLGRNDKGLVTYDRKTKKDAFYFYKANWSSDPVIYITDRRFTPRNVAKGPFKVYSNCESVELRLNGVSLGSKTGDDCVFVWPDVTLARGRNLIQAVGMRAGKEYADRCIIDYDPGVIEMRPVAPTTRPTASH
jgi:beta-galactosidase